MSRMLLWPLDFLGGLALGAFFFVSLWLSVRSLPKARHPVVLALASFWGRTAVVAVAFVVISAGAWQNALICLAGFVTARVMLVRSIPNLKLP